jgi:hypothetical protein
MALRLHAAASTSASPVNCFTRICPSVSASAGVSERAPWTEKGERQTLNGERE